ncbi:hypothetical protein [Streptomyces himalayensis]|uniref:Uncharacterized protein n=1 Tax=Streptomyces himalayensis subsp. himalayensis TaxID=2756131 RepID=A0A7W0DKY4_9ACTN|nr:hypothetical protein [Streptomyces himalayensis]MBA2946543.1 hypothetical protein [Streptomyces himalayensis subsp. himalayensis]
MGRAEAARKAAVTRARNKERAEQARHELAAVREQTAHSSPVALVRYAAALAAHLPQSPEFLRRFTADEAVAELFGLLVDVAAALHPRRRARWWHPQHVSNLLAAPPPSLRSEEAARAGVALRAARSERARQARANRRRAGWR